MTKISNEAIVEIRNVSKTFRTNIEVKALVNVSHEVDKGEVVVVCGPSGSGKSTLLRCINQLETVDQGEIVIDGVSVTDRKTNLNKVRAEVGMVFQSFNLFPHLTVERNVTLAQRVVRKRGQEESVAKSLALLEKVGIHEKAGSYPLPALRGPAAAGGHRPSTGHAAQDHDVRRGHLRAGPGNDR